MIFEQAEYIESTQSSLGWQVGRPPAEHDLERRGVVERRQEASLE